MNYSAGFFKFSCWYMLTETPRRMKLTQFIVDSHKTAGVEPPSAENIVISMDLDLLEKEAAYVTGWNSCLHRISLLLCNIQVTSYDETNRMCCFWYYDLHSLYEARQSMAFSICS